MKMKIKLSGRYTVMVFFLAAFAAGRAGVVKWPEKEAWTPLYSQNGIYSDVQGDLRKTRRDHLDIVGNSTHAAGYLLYRPQASAPTETEDQLLVRIRLDDKIRKHNRGTYQVFFDTDGDDSVDWALQLAIHGRGGARCLRFGEAGGYSRRNIRFYGDYADWIGSVDDYTQYGKEATGDDSCFNGNDDYFVDMAVPWQTFSDLTGIDSVNDPFRVLIATSRRCGRIRGGDIGNFAFVSSRCAPLTSAYGSVIPEPSMAALYALAGGGLLVVRRIFRI